MVSLVEEVPVEPISRGEELAFSVEGLLGDSLLAEVKPSLEDLMLLGILLLEEVRGERSGVLENHLKAGRYLFHSLGLGDEPLEGNVVHW